MEGVNHKTEIEVDPEIADLIPMFLDSRSQDAAKLEDLFKSENFEEMAKICHTIKGIARPYGFPTLESLAIEMESECKRKNAEKTLELVDQMQKFVRNYRERLN